MSAATVDRVLGAEVCFCCGRRSRLFAEPPPISGPSGVSRVIGFGITQHWRGDVPDPPIYRICRRCLGLWPRVAR